MSNQTYIVRQGAIAAVQYITLPDGRQACAVYMSKNTQPEFDVNGRRFSAHELPLPVLAEVNRRFGIIFSHPAERREPIVRAMQPQEITA